MRGDPGGAGQLGVGFGDVAPHSFGGEDAVESAGQVIHDAGEDMFGLSRPGIGDGDAIMIASDLRRQQLGAFVDICVWTSRQSVSVTCGRAARAWSSPLR